MAENRYKIIYEDECIMVVDKPSGMLTIPTPKKEKNTLTDLLNRYLKERGAGASAHPCHRLDRETSGLIIYAKGKKAQGLMMDEFRRRAVKKRYTAFVHGAVRKDLDTIKDRIYNRGKDRNEEAITMYSVIERKRRFTVLDCEPVTGRTNQIRLHMLGIGHPIVGETVFAYRRDFELKFKRVALHARHLEFVHPVTGKRMEFDSPLAADMVKFLSVEREGTR